jgi:hypothetical protein
MKKNTGEFEVLYPEVQTFMTSVTASQLEFGATYTFVVQSHNS